MLLFFPTFNPYMQHTKLESLELFQTFPRRVKNTLDRHARQALLGTTDRESRYPIEDQIANLKQQMTTAQVAHIRTEPRVAWRTNPPNDVWYEAKQYTTWLYKNDYHFIMFDGQGVVGLIYSWVEQYPRPNPRFWYQFLQDYLIRTGNVYCRDGRETVEMFKCRQFLEGDMLGRKTINAGAYTAPLTDNEREHRDTLKQE